MTGLALSTTNEMDVSSKSCLEHGKFRTGLLQRDTAPGRSTVVSVSMVQ